MDGRDIYISSILPVSTIRPPKRSNGTGPPERARRYPGPIGRSAGGIGSRRTICPYHAGVRLAPLRAGVGPVGAPGGNLYYGSYVRILQDEPGIRAADNPLSRAPGPTSSYESMLMKLRAITAADRTAVRPRPPRPAAAGAESLVLDGDMQGKPGRPARPARTTPAGVHLPARPARPPRPPAAPTPPPARQPEPPRPKKPTGLTLQPKPAPQRGDNTSG